MNDFNNVPFFVGFTGASGSGKSTLMKLLQSKLSKDVVLTCIGCDHFYLDLADGFDRSDVNFDIPDMIDFDLMFEVLTKLKNNQTASLPIYSFYHNKRTEKTLTVIPTKVIILEGIFLLYDKRIRNLIDLKVYVDTDIDICLLRRIKRDQIELGRQLESILYIYENQVKPSYEQYVAPLRIYCDLIIPSWPNESALEMLVKGLRDKTDFSRVQSQLMSHLSILPHTFQIRQIMTILRDSETKRQEFVFYLNRLSHLIVEYALGFLPCHTKDVITPYKMIYIGLSNNIPKNICCVSLLKGGECMENGFKTAVPYAPTGKILLTPKFHTHTHTHSNITYCKLPPNFDEKYIFVLDPIIGSGETSIRFVKELIQRGGKEERICYLSLIAYQGGITSLCRHYPNMRVITAEIDDDIDEQGHVLPGLGSVSNRYFGN